MGGISAVWTRTPPSDDPLVGVYANVSVGVSSMRPMTTRVDRARLAAEDHRTRYALADRHGGNDLRNAVKVHWKKATFTTWDEAVAELRDGVTITMSCFNRQEGTRGSANGPTWGTHKVRLNPDGTLGLLNHPGLVVDADAELMLFALGGAMRSCVAAAIHLPTRKPVPGSLPSHHMLNTRVRTLYTAVAWAQRPDHVWTPEFGQSYLRYGITPLVLDEWLADGWAEPEALRFLHEFADRSVANAWREAGETTHRAARMAGLGQYPNEDARWVAAGFTAAQSARWRKFNYSPEEAFGWHAHRIPPTLAADFQRRAGMHGNPELDLIKQWCAAGVPASDMLAWYRETNGDLSEALDWKQALKAWQYGKFRDWNQRRPGSVLSAAQVKGYTKVGFPRDNPEQMWTAINAGVTPQIYADAIASLREENSPLRRALRAQALPPKREWAFYGFDKPGPVDPWGYRVAEQGTGHDLSRFIVDWVIAQQRAA